VLKCVDLFCGCGGFSLGFKMMNFEILFGLDNNETCIETYKRNIKPLKIICEDIRHFSDDFEADVIIGSPPCKSFSFASQRRYKPDPENDLIFEFERIVRKARPRAFVFENVVGLRVGWRKELVMRLKEKLQKSGFFIADLILDAFDFGVPQHRKRLFLLGMRKPFFLNLPFRQSGKTVRSAFRGIENQPNHIWTRSKRALEIMQFIPQGKSLSRVWQHLPKHLQERYNSFKNMHNNIYFRLAWSKPSITICHPRKAMILHPEENRVIR